MRVLTGFLGFLFIYLSYQFVWGKGGYLEYQTRQQELVQAQNETKRLNQRNQQLAVKVEDLKKRFNLIEEKARMEYGMIGKEEVFYQLPMEKGE